MYRGVVIGCGAIGSRIDETGHPLGVQSHASAYGKCTRTELVGVCDIDKERAAACARVRDVPFYCTDHLALLAACRPDMVSVAVETEAHAAILRDVIAFPGVRLVICEKPIAKTTAEASILIAQAAERGCRLIVNYTRHFLPMTTMVGKMIAAGQIGEVRVVNGFYTKSITHNGTHLLDLLRCWCGELNVLTACRASWPGTSIEHVDVTLRLSSGATATLHALDACDYSLFEIDIIGSRGRIRVTDGGNRVACYRVRDHALFTGYRELEPTSQLLESCLQDMMRYVIDASCDLLDGVALAQGRYCSGEQALAVLNLAEQAMKAAGDSP
jgi:predicted dehydrogenase